MIDLSQYPADERSQQIAARSESLDLRIFDGTIVSDELKNEIAILRADVVQYLTELADETLINSESGFPTWSDLISCVQHRLAAYLISEGHDFHSVDMIANQDDRSASLKVFDNLKNLVRTVPIDLKNAVVDRGNWRPNTPYSHRDVVEFEGWFWFAAADLPKGSPRECSVWKLANEPEVARSKLLH